MCRHLRAGSGRNTRQNWKFRDVGVKGSFFFPLLPEEDIIKVVVDFFLFKRGGEAGKKGFQPMRKKLGEKFGVVFFFAVIVTDTELLARMQYE